MLWFYVLVIAAVAAAFWFYGARRRSTLDSGRRRTLTEASAEIGVPPEAIDHERALLSDRLAGVQRPMARSREEGSEEAAKPEGALRARDLRKDNLSKEVELDWEATKLIERQPGAYAWPRDFRDEPSKGFLRRTGEEGVLSSRDYTLPERYGRDRLVLMARDPHFVYAYWELAHDRYRELREKRLSEWGLSRPVLRLYDMTDPSLFRVLDVDLKDEADNWYVRVDRPRHRFVAEIGRMFPDGFVALLRSNEVSLPPDSPSMEISEEWAPLDWEANYGRFTNKIGVSSPGTWVR